MSEIVQHATYSRVFQLVKAAGAEGVMVVAAISSPTSLTKGKEYRLLVEEDDTLYYVDDADIPCYLVYPQELERFEPLVNVSDVIEKIGTYEGRAQERVAELVAQIKKIPTEPSSLQPNDVVVMTDGDPERVFIVAKLLTREEMRYVGRVVETLMAHDVLAYSLHGDVVASILISHRVKKIGTLQDFGQEPLAPGLLEKLTVFDAVSQAA